MLHTVDGVWAPRWERPASSQGSERPKLMRSARSVIARTTQSRKRADAQPVGAGNHRVVTIPRGGVPVAAEIATALEAPLDVIIVRKIGAPWQPEYAIGAIAEGGVRIVAERELSLLRLGQTELGALVASAEQELAERSERYRGPGPPLELKGRTVLLVDGGLATGRTAQAAARPSRARRGARGARGAGRGRAVGARDRRQRGRGDSRAHTVGSGCGRVLVSRLSPYRR